MVVTARRRETSARFEPPALVDKTLRFVKLFYGTNRERRTGCAGVTETRWDAPKPCRPNSYYGADMAAGGDDDGLEVGTLSVTFPSGHRRGKVERPLKIFSFTLGEEDPERHVVISELRSYPSDHAAWAADVRATGRDQAFIYVHGFANTFDDAARGAAQLAYDLDFDLDSDFRGVPMLFSWPSRGEVGAYINDMEAASAATEAFNRFLDLVKQDGSIRRVHVIAHSMGNRVVTEALWARRNATPTPITPITPIVDELVLAAPDVWAKLFRDRFLRTLPLMAARVTLYVSDHDRALTASSVIRKEEPRAGQVAGGLLEASQGIDRFDAVNASSLKSDFLGHSYYANDHAMLGDIYCLLKGTPARGRPLLTVAGAAWQFRSAADLALVDAAACVAAVVEPTSNLNRPSRFRWLGVAIGSLVAGALLLAAVARRRRRR